MRKLRRKVERLFITFLMVKGQIGMGAAPLGLLAGSSLAILAFITRIVRGLAGGQASLSAVITSANPLELLATVIAVAYLGTSLVKFLKRRSRRFFKR